LECKESEKNKTMCYIIFTMCLVGKFYNSKKNIREFELHLFNWENSKENY